MTDFYRTLVNETIYGTDCIVLDDPTIREFLDWKSVESTRVNESSKVQGVYSDEGLYDFFIGFDEYKRVTDFKAKQILGWNPKGNLPEWISTYTDTLLSKHKKVLSCSSSATGQIPFA